MILAYLQAGLSLQKNSADLSLNLERDSPQIIEFEFYVPTDALGSDDAQVPLTITLDQDQSITTTVTLPLEVQRTRGLSLQGSTDSRPELVMGAQVMSPMYG